MLEECSVKASAGMVQRYCIWHGEATILVAAMLLKAKPLAATAPQLLIQFTDLLARFALWSQPEQC